ncbi:methionine--tRNA ligase subunit beta [Candidatus Jorgensenbacteria bacterium]|nr:methionine--tRNA ligase subunit beta [Candidatus Jorgensenbacteria bacterium]
MITFDEFKKLDLRIGKILSVEQVVGSDKLLRLSIDVGEKDEKGEVVSRQIVAGIKSNYSPESLIGKNIVVLVNLEPRMIMGIESRGMLLAADATGPIVLTADRDVPPGSKIR